MYRKNKDKVEYLGLFNIFDLSENLSKEIAASIGTNNSEILKVFGTMGLAKNDGTPKKAWNVFLEEMKKN